VWLIVLELTVVRCFVYQFNFDYRVTMLLVLSALGWAMIALAALVRLPVIWAATIGAVLIGAHNLLDGMTLPPILAVPLSAIRRLIASSPRSLGWPWLVSSTTRLGVR